MAALEGSHTHTRQKSCRPCVKAKRKCDLKTPICSRCASRSFLCEYNKTDGAKSHDDGDNEYTQRIDHVDHIMLEGYLDDRLVQTPAIDNRTLDMKVLSNTESPSSVSGVESNICLFEDAFFGAYNEMITPISDIGVMERDRIRFCVEQLKSYPAKLSKYGRTPFIHPRAYEPLIPPPLQEACCAAALYMGKTEANETIVWDIISAKADQLVAPRGPCSLSEHLVNVQALIIFQIIRLFDGDIRQRREAEEHEEILTRWTDGLVSRTGILTTSSATMLPASWDSWVFQEVTCRTAIASRMLQSMFSIQKHGFCTLVSAVTALSFTLQKTMWEAPTAAHWEKALKEKNRYHALHMDFTDIISSARPEDIDDLGLLMLVTYLGIDGVNEWVAGTGSSALIM